MRNIIFLLFTVSIVYGQGIVTKPCEESSYQALDEDLENIMQQIISAGVPGMVAAIESKGVLSMGSAGLAKIEDQMPMQSCHLHYLGSIPKTYMATLMMKLYEENKVDLNAKIMDYLPKDLLTYVNGLEKITIKMLLNHTSGLPEYNSIAGYITLLIQYPDKVFTPEEMLRFIDGKKLLYEPGSRYQYTNTNYELLSIIADQITGDHATYMREMIFKPLGLDNSYYRISAGDTYDNRLVNSYWDRYSDGIVENSSVLLNSNTASMAGDDGMICTAADAIKFLKALMEGKIVSPESLAMMKEWVNDINGNPTYGLGLDLTEMNGQPAIGHSGGGLGTGAQLYFFPEKDMYVFLVINLATVTESPLHDQLEPLLSKLYDVILSDE
jgi:D-alanyl-D-alanine carboxypeptidase